jgi:hypothetical protein
MFSVVLVPLVSVVISTRARPVWPARAGGCPRADTFVDRAAAVSDNAHQLHSGNSSRFQNLGNSLDITHRPLPRLGVGRAFVGVLRERRTRLL